MPDLELPAIGEAERELLIHEVCADATSYRDIKDKPVRDAVRGWLTYAQQQQIEKFAPRAHRSPRRPTREDHLLGRRGSLHRHRIQDLYGLKSSLRIAGGRVPVTIQVLAPNMRPVQVTTDLANFWAEVYPKLKPQLSRRYPKHEWR